MSKHSFHALSVIIILSIVLSCQELYDAPLDKTQNKFLVVEGKISNIGSSTKIRLTRAIGFNDNENEYNSSIETKATVTISDENGFTIPLQEIGDGYYEAGNYIGYIGGTYTLKIKTSDGAIYESSPETMHPPSNNFSLTAEQATKDVEKITGNGETQFVTQNGVNFYVDLKTNQNVSAFYKFDTRVVLETIHAEWRGGRCLLCNPIYVYCWAVFGLEDLPTVKETIIIDGVGAIKHYNLGFLQAAIFDLSLADEIRDPPRTVGWILSCNVSCISEKEFLYYSKLRDQLSANSKIFDPLPTQLLSNIKCVTDNSKIVLGYFSVSSQFTKEYFVKYNQGDPGIKKHDLYGIPEFIYPNCVDTYPPAFWQEEFQN